jgi:hypothetical protein
MYRFSRWKDPLFDARSVGDVERVMGEYLKTLEPLNIEALPRSCREAMSTQDISVSALILTREDLTFHGNPETAAILHEVANTYIAASNRIVQIQGRGEPVGNTLP